MKGQVEAIFVMGGLSKKEQPYLQVSDGIEAQFVRLHPDFKKKITKDTFSSYEKGSSISLEIEATAFGVTVVDVLED